MHSGQNRMARFAELRQQIVSLKEQNEQLSTLLSQKIIQESGEAKLGDKNVEVLRVELELTKLRYQNERLHRLIELST